MVVGGYHQEQRWQDLWIVCQPLRTCRNVSTSFSLVFLSFIIRIRYNPLILSTSTNQDAVVRKCLYTLTPTQILTEQGDSSSQAFTALKLPRLCRLRLRLCIYTEYPHQC